jgi:hypothetical protein
MPTGATTRTGWCQYLQLTDEASPTMWACRVDAPRSYVSTAASAYFNLPTAGTVKGVCNNA